ncbi:MAG: hypothetical protein H3C36_14700 [Chitinophagaceae bacterium]|nr:hypothetical protein [Chitinophagaceae bacterium]
MHINDLLAAFDKAGKRTHFIGNHRAGVLVALDMEGRLFTVWNGEVVNRVNADAIRFHSDQDTYYNPGGDVLWPAPEGTLMGYQYPTGKWRVAPGINNKGIGLATLFGRDIRVAGDENEVIVNVKESITYTGKKVLLSSEAIIAPWTLCQFDTDYRGKVTFPCSDPAELWDMYSETIAGECLLRNEMMEVPADGKKRFQVGLSPSVPWIAFHHVQQGLTVKRTAKKIDPDHSYIDIRDADPECEPDSRGVRFSIYNDNSGFMEIEAVGGCPEKTVPGTVLSVEVETSYGLI